MEPVETPHNDLRSTSCFSLNLRGHGRLLTGTFKRCFPVPPALSGRLSDGAAAVLWEANEG